MLMSDYSNFINSMDYNTFFSIIDNMYDEIIVYDGNYNIVFVNQACNRHYCCSPDFMIGKTFFDFINEDWWRPSILPIVYKEKKALAIKQKTYTNSELLTIAVPLFDEKNEIRFVVMNVRDVVNEIDLYNPHYISTTYNVDNKLIPIAESEEMKNVIELVKKVSKVDTTCIITGESGTGKTMIAKYMHSISPRKDKPFISLNCASIPNELIESELFGYTKGAFTGANSSGKKGLLETADTGTILLDEISELSLVAQAKLLTVLQEKEFLPVGASKPVKVDVKIITATNKNLKNMVEMGTFREDLYYRINVVDIYIAPLRKRKKDIPHIINHFLSYFNSKYGVSRQLSREAIQVLTDYEWKGNVRELRHVIERLVVTMDSLIIDVTQLPKNLFGITDYCNVSIGEKDTTFSEKMEKYESYIVQEAYNKCGSSRKLAEYLSISQTKANNLIKKYINQNARL